MTETISWIESPSWELDFFGLPHRIPWPSEVDPETANEQPFPVDKLLDAVQALGPEAGEPWLSFATAAEKFQDLAEALEENEIPRAAALLDEVEALYPGSAFALFHRAYVARQEGREGDAVQLYRTVTEKTPMIAVGWINLGAVLAAAGRREEAVAAFHEALRRSPNDPLALEGLAALREVVKLKANDPRSSEAFAYVDVPTFRGMAATRIQGMVDPEQLREYGEQLLRDGIVPQVAVEALERANDLLPRNKRIMLGLGGAYHQAGEMAKARDVMSRYTMVFPDDAQGYFRVAQMERTLGNAAGERAALERTLEVDPNFQPALVVRFGLVPGVHDPAVEDQLERFGKERNSWMACVLASVVARERGDHAAALRQAERALAIDPENEEALLHYAVALGGAKELGKLATVIRPAVESGKFSKRLDWNYAHVLRELGLTKDAVAVLRKAALDAPEDFRKMAETMIDAWSGLVSGCGVRLEVNPAGLLMRPILITLADGDGGVIVDLGAQLPAEGRFPWRATGGQEFVTLQQGHSGAREPRPLGAFRVRGIAASSAAPAAIDCELVAMPDGNIHFRARQGNRKLPVTWMESNAG